MKMCEPFLPARQSPKGDGGNKTDAPPRRRLADTRRPSKNIFFTIFDFAHSLKIFSIKEKKIFLLDSALNASGRAAGLPTAIFFGGRATNQKG
ncbi:hypothetical protein KKB33_02345 [Patescibacteria group bacterium]|nr:hypothetical protein [Patescibacteria group bacterium]